MSVATILISTVRQQAISTVLISRYVAPGASGSMTAAEILEVLGFPEGLTALSRDEDGVLSITIDGVTTNHTGFTP